MRFVFTRREAQYFDNVPLLTLACLLDVCLVNHSSKKVPCRKSATDNQTVDVCAEDIFNVIKSVLCY